MNWRQKKWLENVVLFFFPVNSQFLLQAPRRFEKKIFLNIYFIIFHSVGSWQLIATVGERKVFDYARRKKEKREALIKHSSLGIQRYIGKISSLSDEKQNCVNLSICAKRKFTTNKAAIIN